MMAPARWLRRRIFRHLGYSVSEPAPKGRKKIAWGVSPRTWWEKIKSPGGATEIVALCRRTKALYVQTTELLTGRVLESLGCKECR